MKPGDMARIRASMQQRAGGDEQVAKAVDLLYEKMQAVLRLEAKFTKVAAKLGKRPQEGSPTHAQVG